MSADGKSYALTWPATLPKPTLKGNVATYTDAAGKGADLVVTVLPTGFRHDVVLRERPAKPLELRIGVDTGGLTLSKGKGGRLLLTDTSTGKDKDKGRKLVASAPQPVMWDASAGARLAKGRLPQARHAKIATNVVTTGGRTELVLKPDHTFLSAPATVYPVRVDPTTTLPFNHDVEVSTLNDADFPADPTAAFMMAGTRDGQKFRVHLRFDTAALTGATVSDAKLSLNNIDAPSCGAAVGAGIQVRRLTGAWDENNLYWANLPTSTTEDAQINRAAINESCATWPGSMDWNVTGIAQDWATGAANHGLVLQSPTETNVNNYRAFTSSEDTDFNNPPKLTVTTTGPASAPAVSNLTITPAQATGGVTTVTSLTPQLAATVSDTIGGPLTGEFEIEHDPAATGQGTGQIWTGSSAPVASGNQATAAVPAGKLTDGWKVRWRARAANTIAATVSAWSAWQTATVDVPNPAVGAFQVTPSQQVNGVTVTTSLTPTLHTTVTDPAAQPLRAEVELEHDPTATGQGAGQIWTGSLDNVVSGTQVGLTVPVAKLTDGWKVRWRARAINTATTIGSPWSAWQALSVDLPDPVSEPAVGAMQVTPSQQVDGTTVTPTLTPTLLAQVSDPAGGALRAEAEIEHDPAATGQGNGQIWTGSADNVASGTQAGITVPAGTLSDGWKVRWRLRAITEQVASAWSDWRQVTVDVTQPGEEPLAQTAGPVIRTDQSFTTAAWLRWSDKDGDYTVLEQKGTHQAPFRLGNTPDRGLVFTFTSADAAGATVEGVLSDVEPPADEWFHLAGVYDAMAKTASLYLNGTQIGTSQLTSASWNADTPMRLGSNLIGTIDDAEVFQRALSITDVAALHTESVGVTLRRAATAAKNSGSAKAIATQAAFVNQFNYEHINEQQCKDSDVNADKYKQARIQEKPYVSCWSAYLNFVNYREDKDTRRMKKASLGSVIFKALLKYFTNLDDDDVFRLRATWVMHSYLGDTTGENIIGPAGDLRAQDIKLFMRIEEIELLDRPGVIKLKSDQLRGLNLGLAAAATAKRDGADCRVRSGSGQTRDIAGWRSKPDLQMIIRASSATPKDTWGCTIMPYLTVADEDGSGRAVRVPLWSQRVKDTNGQDRYVLRQGDVLETGSQVDAPRFKCDTISLGFSNFKRVGGCVNGRASRVFRMSESQDDEFLPVIEHIKSALNKATNSTTAPPLRDGHDWSWENREHPPTRRPVGTRKAKDIPGNWDDPTSPALTKLSQGVSDTYNRDYWSNIKMYMDLETGEPKTWNQSRGTNWCKYYFPDDYPKPPAENLPPFTRDVQCDEYPFASTKEGARNAKGHFSLRAVATVPNRLHGDAVRNFYADYRVGPDNRFWVQVVP
ncbi:DNRLRE domain-containing protein [Streptosporangium sp. NPDC049248]|uniref:DNRLRE domain-containing protein n=1 Tax=Streptosporangium sp. NPDC049248 TaxID=3155651 RepID=UPI003438B9C0